MARAGFCPNYTCSTGTLRVRSCLPHRNTWQRVCTGRLIDLQQAPKRSLSAGQETKRLPAALQEAHTAAADNTAPTHKYCSGCEDERLLVEFGRLATSADGLYYLCRFCLQKRGVARDPARLDTPHPAGSKVCNKCCVPKPSKDFPKRTAAHDGLHNTCRACDSARRKAARLQAIALRATLQGVEGPEGVLKPCPTCRVSKPLEEFHNNSATKDGKQSECKSCTRLRDRARHQRLLKVKSPARASKRCNQCGETKVASAFRKNLSQGDGLSSVCKHCHDAIYQPLSEPTVSTQICSECGEEKPASEFWKRAREATGLHPQCKACAAKEPAVNEKQCYTCVVFKPAAAFYPTPAAKDGLSSACRACTKAQARVRYHEARAKLEQVPADT